MTNPSENVADGPPQFVERLKTAVQWAGGQSKVGALTDRTPRQIRRYLDGDEAPLSVVSRIAEAANVTLDWLVSGRLPMHHIETLDRFQSATREPRAIIDPDNFVLIPRYDVAASAGAGAIIESDRLVDFLAFKKDWIRRTLALDPQRLAVISAEGDSMRPTIAEGDVLLVDTKITNVRDSAIYVLQLGGVLLVKRLRIRLDGGVDVISDNPAYPVESVAQRDLDRLAIAGRVVWHGGLV